MSDSTYILKSGSVPLFLINIVLSSLRYNFKPSKLEVLEGPNAVLTASDNIVVRDDNKEVVARGTEKGQLLSGDKKALQEAINNKDKDMGR